MGTPVDPGSHAAARTAAAAVVGAFVFGLGVTLALFAWMIATTEGRVTDSVVKIVRSWLTIGFYVGAFLGLPGALTLGVLAHALLRRVGVRSPGAYAVTGLALGALAAAACVAAGGYDFAVGTRLDHYRLWVPVGAVGGLAGGAAFWLVRRP